MLNTTNPEIEAWDYVNRWAERTASDRLRRSVKSGKEPVEDAVTVTAVLLRAGFPGHQGDGFIGSATFEALGDRVTAELYHPLRMLYGVVPHHPNGMPMQGLLSTMRVFEHEASLMHVGVDGELYAPAVEPMTVNPTPMEIMSKLAVLAYFETRAKVALQA